MAKVDLIAVTVALAAHATLAFGLSHLRPPEPKRSSTVEFEVRKAPPPPPPVIIPEPEKPPEPPPPERKIVVKKSPEPFVPPPPSNAPPPKEPPKEPPKPVFGVSMSSTTEGDSSVAVPVGNTTMIDPSKSAKGVPVVPLPAAPVARAVPAYAPISELDLKRAPDIDSDACGQSVPYPQEAEQLGIEGTVHLRIELDEKGHVHDLRVIGGPGHGLERAASFALKYKCKFTPAIASDGKPAAYVIQDYKFNFELPK